ncbi:MAG: hypothetical protein LM601_09660 [Candidatus Verstraetearchaeota archaeon]|jgi:hypothetical protein|nr:hypothetical protein [Candidatus Verstraetearchaeota archaeon]
MSKQQIAKKELIVMEREEFEAFFELVQAAVKLLRKYDELNHELKKSLR